MAKWNVARIRVVTFKLVCKCGAELGDPYASEEEDDSTFSEVSWPQHSITCDVCGKEMRVPEEKIKEMFRR